MEILSNKVIGLLPKNKIHIFGKDGLMNNTIPYYLLAFLMLLASTGSIDVGFFFIFLIYTILPFLDEIFSLDLRNPDEKERKRLEENDGYFRMALYAAIVADWCLFFKAMNTFSTL